MRANSKDEGVVGFGVMFFVALVVGGLSLISKIYDNKLNGTRSANVLGNTDTVLPTTPTETPTVTQTPLPTKTVIKKPVNNQQTITHDGSRTGRIVDYFSLCEKKNVKVYENELMLYTRKSGTQLYSTKTDIQCYEKEYGELVNQNNQPKNTTTTYNPVIYYPCTLCYHYSTGDQCTTYNNLVTSKAACDAEQKKTGSYGTSYIVPTVAAPTIDAAYQELIRQHDQACKDAVSEWYGIKGSFYSNEYNNFSSSSEAVAELTRRKNAYQQELNSVGCGTYTVSIY